MLFREKWLVDVCGDGDSGSESDFCSWTKKQNEGETGQEDIYIEREIVGKAFARADAFCL